MDWNLLLNQTRRRNPSVPQTDEHKYASAFASDFRRVVTSSAFRRLKDKTQVFPLEEHDFVRTRLTHSMEVAAIGEELGVSVAQAVLKERGALTAEQAREIPEVVRTACLLHDLGNPPFGHAGERAIHRWFDRHFKDKVKSADGASHDWKDYLRFDGNAQTFRIVTRLQNNGLAGGMNLTAAVRASIVKYPWQAYACPRGDKNKSGYLATERPIFELTRLDTGLEGMARHPLTYIVEAADDIAYGLADLEDGLKKGAFRLDDLISCLSPLGDEGVDLVQVLRKRIDELKGLAASEADQKAYQHVRAVATGKMIAACTRAFVAHYDRIMAGEFMTNVQNYPDSLVKQSKYGKVVEGISDFARENVYTMPAVLMRERAGFEVVGTLLDTLMDDEKLFKRLFPRDSIAESDAPNEQYRQVQQAVDYVCGTTDRYAVTLYRKLKGISL